QVLERVLAAGLAHDDLALGEVLAVGAIEHDVRRSRVDVLGDGDVVEAGLAGAATATVMKGTGVRDAPLPAEDVDLVLVLLVDRLALDAIELEKHVHCHDTDPS